MAKKTGPYRKVVKVEFIEAGAHIPKGEVREMHPKLAKKLIDEGKAKKTPKPLTNAPILPSSKIKEEK